MLNSPLFLLCILIASEIVLFAFPAIVWALIGRQRLVDAFAWKRPSWQEIVGAVFLAVGMVYCVTVEMVVQCHFTPSLADSMRTTMQMLLPIMTRYPWLLLIILPLSAAIGEEMFFRGPLQRALVRRLPVWAALSIGALIFSIAHLDLLGLIARFVLGIILGWMVLRGGSLFPAMLMHFIYDAAVLGTSIWQLRVYGEKYVMATSDPMFGVTLSSILIDAGIGTGLLLIGFRLCSIAYKRKATLQSPAPLLETPVEVLQD